MFYHHYYYHYGHPPSRVQQPIVSGEFSCKCFKFCAKLGFLVDAPLLYVQIEYAPTKGKFFFWDFSVRCLSPKHLLNSFPYMDMDIRIYGWIYGYTDIWMDIYMDTSGMFKREPLSIVGVHNQSVPGRERFEISKKISQKLLFFKKICRQWSELWQ